MADVFLSYASADRPIAERLARAIEQAGLSVWWDRHIKGGAEFSRDIEQQLDEARHVLVLWSKEAINSRWVRDEASVAADTKRLVAATIDGTPAPLGFRQFQTIDLRKWTARTPDLPAELLEALDVDTGSTDETALIPGQRRRRLLLVLAVAAAFLLGTAALFVSREGGFGSLFSDERESISLAVMPFEVSGRGDLAYLSTGLAGALSNGLARLDGVSIIATSSARAVSEEELTANQAGAKLNASHLVEGEILPSGEKVSVTVRLVDTKSGEQLWAQTYSGLEGDLGRLEFAIGKDLSAALQSRLGVGSGQLVDRGKIDPRAYEAYLKGIERISLRADDEARKEAVRQFQLATNIAPDFADAHAGLAYILSLSVPPQIGITKDELVARQRRANDRALSLDPDNILALVARANTHANFTGDVEQGLALARSIVERAPDFGPGHYVLGSILTLAGNIHEAIPHYDRAVESDPYNQIQIFTRAIAAGQIGDYEGVRRAALECKNGCDRFNFLWMATLIDIGTPFELERDFSGLFERLNKSVPADQAEEIRTIVPALVQGKPCLMGPAPDEAWGFDYAAVLSRCGRLDDAFRVFRWTAGRSQADMAETILTDGRLSFPPEARADPRYHAVFRDFPHLRLIEAARRKNGILGGLPVAAADVQKEKQRLAAISRN